MRPKLLDLQDGSQVLLDEDDWHLVEGYAWYRTHNGYVGAMAVRDGKRAMVLMHRLVTDAPKGTHVDHLNGNTLDNRRCNLRVTTPVLNQVNRKRLNKNNSSGVRGVAFVPRWGKWKAQIMAHRVAHHLGMFATKEEAIAARKSAELKYWGELCPSQNS